ncbi:MAG TPA: metallophosphoesterase [Candidatus Binatia bacterium]|nr:metallophosphoesterase [Candidatus Binatia bacterium]
MGFLDVLLRWPNIGHPCLVRKSSGNQTKTTFKVIFAGADQTIDLKNALDNMCFLQTLKDTRQVFQDVFTPETWKKSVDEVGKIVQDALFMDCWPGDLKQRLIPLSIVQVDPPKASSWEGHHVQIEAAPYPIANTLLHYDYAYTVTMQIESKYLLNAEIPQMFNFIHITPEFFYNINFHSVYLNDQNWHDFNIIHAADPHVAWRNDFIKKTVQDTLGNGSAKSCVSFNDNFRKFICMANERHRKGEADLILLTGDLVDFIEINRKFVNSPEVPEDNFNFLRNQLIAWKTLPEMKVSEELELPLFTMLGNHDYRLAEYPLIGTYEWCGGVDVSSVDESKNFILTPDEARAYESGLSKEQPYFDLTTGLFHQSHLSRVHPSYLSYLNPDQNYSIQLGKHRIVCLDSGPDKGEMTGLWEGFWNHSPDPVHDSRYDFMYGTPDGEGFSEEQIRFIEEQINDVDGLIILACHHPTINYKSVPPPHYFRECEHQKLSKDDEQNLVFILRTDYARYIESTMFPVARELVPEGRLVEMIDKAWNANTQEVKSCISKWAKGAGFPLGVTSYFKMGERDPELGRGVPDERFRDFFTAITKKTKNQKKAELVLTGHTHYSIEYSASWENKLIQPFEGNLGQWTGKPPIFFLHDYYLDGTVGGELPTCFWQKLPEGYPKPPDKEKTLPEYPDPLNKTTDPQKWWKDHSPLFIQTESVAYPNDWQKYQNAFPKPTSPIGFLRIIVKNDVIVCVEREKLLSPPLFTTIPSGQPFFILASSPP